MFDACPASCGEVVARGGVVRQVQDSTVKPIRIADRIDGNRAVVACDFEMRRDVRCDARKAARHGFRKGEPEAFRCGRSDEQVECGVDGIHVLAILDPDDSIFRQRSDLRLQCGRVCLFVRALRSDKDETGVRHVGEKPTECLDKICLSLAFPDDAYGADGDVAIGESELGADLRSPRMVRAKTQGIHTVRDDFVEVFGKAIPRLRRGGGGAAHGNKPVGSRSEKAIDKACLRAEPIVGGVQHADSARYPGGHRRDPTENSREKVMDDDDLGAGAAQVRSEPKDGLAVWNQGGWARFVHCRPRFERDAFGGKCAGPWVVRQERADLGEVSLLGEASTDFQDDPLESAVTNARQDVSHANLSMDAHAMRIGRSCGRLSRDGNLRIPFCGVRSMVGMTSQRKTGASPSPYGGEFTFCSMADPDQRKNCFDAMRLIAASLVLVSHGWALLGQIEYDFIWRWTKGGFSASWLGLAVFFSLSGFLIDSSSQNCSNWKVFARRRILRLWPALAVVVLVTTFIVGPIVTKYTWSQYFSNFQTWLYLSSLTVWGMRWKLPGVFYQNPLPEVNGSLWTLPYETSFYVVSWAFRDTEKRQRFYAPFVAFAIGLALRMFAYEAIEAIPFRPFFLGLQHLLNFGLFYLAGSCIQRLWGRKKVLWWIFAGVLLVWVSCLGYENVRRPIDFVILPMGSILLGSLPVPIISRASRFGDFSYGVYIWGFPVQQMLVYCIGPTGLTPTKLAIFGLFCALPLAFASWHLIEKPALVRKKQEMNLGILKL